MARNRQNLNIIYISDRMRETLRPIASCALTAVVAPMGYGKTTAMLFPEYTSGKYLSRFSR